LFRELLQKPSVLSRVKVLGDTIFTTKCDGISSWLLFGAFRGGYDLGKIST
jgi:hypothetical protein